VFEIGNSLREARLRQGVDFSEIELATKIRAKHLKALEDEEFDVLPAQTYVKGFLRTYAEYLGLDGQLYVDEFNSRFATGEDELNPIARSNVTRHRRVDSRTVLFVVLGIAAVTALVVAASRGTSGGSNAPLSKVDRDQKRQQKPKRTAKRERPTGKPHKANLILTASQGPSWIEVHVDSPVGEQLFEGTLEQGRTQYFKARKLWLNVGQPASLTWKVNGKLVPAPATDVATFVVTRKGVKQAPSPA